MHKIQNKRISCFIDFYRFLIQKISYMGLLEKVKYP